MKPGVQVRAKELGVYIEAAVAGLHVVTPDQRGYNLSDKPPGASSYDLDGLAADVGVAVISDAIASLASH